MAVSTLEVKITRFAAVALATVALGSTPASAQEPFHLEITPEMRGSLGFDLLYGTVGGALYFTGWFAVTPRDKDKGPLVGGHHPHDRARDVASDVTLALGVGVVPIAAFLIDADLRGSGRERWVRALRTPLTIAESLVMTIGVFAWLKNTGVCRPYGWDEATRTCGDGVGVPEGGEEQRRAFPSGHAGNTGAVAGALLGMWLFPTERNDRLAGPAIAATALSLTTAALRARAGAHSFADVSVGFLLSTAIGLGTAALHLGPTRNVRIDVTGNGLRLTHQF
jgi:membrane-associated phospholipid phosphatase